MLSVNLVGICAIYCLDVSGEDNDELSQYGQELLRIIKR